MSLQEGPWNSPPFYGPLGEVAPAGLLVSPRSVHLVEYHGLPGTMMREAMCVLDAPIGHHMSLLLPVSLQVTGGNRSPLIAVMIAAAQPVSRSRR